MDTSFLLCSSTAKRARLSSSRLFCLSLKSRISPNPGRNLINPPSLQRPNSLTAANTRKQTTKSTYCLLRFISLGFESIEVELCLGDEESDSVRNVKMEKRISWRAALRVIRRLLTECQTHPYVWIMCSLQQILLKCSKVCTCSLDSSPASVKTFDFSPISYKIIDSK